MEDDELSLLQFQINIVSARDLESTSRTMQTYAVVYINPDQKMTSMTNTTGNNCPEWNEKFTFFVVSQILYSDFCNVVVEIYARSWMRDVLVGSVHVPAHQIIPAHPTSQTRRAVALQIRRPSGRPQGILNVAVSLIEEMNKSMPLSGVGGPPEEKSTKHRKSDKVRRVRSERSSVTNDDDPSIVNGTGGVGAGSMCSSDVGPSASVVAAAVARGLYVPPNMKGGRKNKKGGGGMKDDGESSILQWADEESEEAMKAKIERWKTELGMNDNNGGGEDDDGVHEGGARRTHRRRHSEPEPGKSKVFRCFGNGFEFTIVCGGNNNSNNNNIGEGKRGPNKKTGRAMSEASSYITL